MKLKTLIAIFVVVLPGFALATGEKAGYETRCGKMPAPIPAGGFCIMKPLGPQTELPDLVYSLHGLGGNENEWQESFFFTSQILKQWSVTGAKRPIIVSVSFGPVWLLASKNTSPQSGLLEVFTQQVMPQIESALGGKFSRRILLGISMGGFNSVSLALKTKLFAKAAILCSPMADISPFASKEAIIEFAKKSAAWQYYKDSSPETVLNTIENAVRLSQTFFPTEKDWKGGDPLQLAPLFNAESTQKFYVSVGQYDKYVNYEGNEKFAEVLKAKGADVEWRPQWGGHCAIDIASLSKFLTE